MTIRLAVLAAASVTTLLALSADPQSAEAQSIDASLGAQSAAAAAADLPSLASSADGDVFAPYDNGLAGGTSVGCGHCGGAGCNRCGCTPMLFPWIEGPGTCDQWCVGPRWEVQAAGLMLFRDDADWDRISAAVGAAPDFVSQFDHGPGGRIFVTGYNDDGLGMQVGYEGIFQWTARSEFPAAGSLRAFDYESHLNSLEINFTRRGVRPWQWFAGFRYVDIDEDFVDFTTVDKVFPAPADPPAAPAAFVDSGTSYLLDNQLFGFQVGGFRDTWRVGRRLTFMPFANAGVYCNKFKRTNLTRVVTTVINGDDLATPDVDEFSQTVTQTQTGIRRDFTDIAFLGEAGITGVWQLTRCLALRAGYQVIVVDGVGEGLDAFFVSDLQTSTLIYHGAQFGIEYRR